MFGIFLKKSKKEWIEEIIYEKVPQDLRQCYVVKITQSAFYFCNKNLLKTSICSKNFGFSNPHELIIYELIKPWLYKVSENIYSGKFNEWVINSSYNTV